MDLFKRSLVWAPAMAVAVWLSACAPAVGSDKWCQQLKDKPKGDWSMNEAADFAKHCILK
ncbi:DUF3012 domain-containing protein [Hydrogenophaga sp. OTU3427]|uniref:DUF3012 domain-containing protein n=1 Tax=Hydrogenophaga sp. OTU3427 TaxID=3043856 RepID=UPI00313ED2F0